MRRAAPAAERARQRVLSDQELRVMWSIFDQTGTYGAAAKCMLLVAQRAHKVRKMRWSEIIDGVLDPKNGQAIDSVWDPPRDEGDRKNKKVSVVPLSRLTREILDAVTIIDDGDYVFSLNGSSSINSWSKYKGKVHRQMVAALGKVEPWQWRDLRRTARTLMSRAGISTEISDGLWATS